MHELSIAQSIVDYTESEIEKNEARTATEVDVEVGELMQVDVAALGDILGSLMRGPRLEGCKVKVRVAQAKFRCQKCGNDWSMEEVRKQLAGTTDSLLVREPDSKELPLHFLPSLYSSFVHCPKCGSVDILAEAGENIRIRKLVME